VLCKKKDRFVYSRSLNGTEFVIDCNLCDKPKKAWKNEGYEFVLPAEVVDTGTLQPYEARVLRKK